MVHEQGIIMLTCPKEEKEEMQQLYKATLCISKFDDAAE